MNKIDQQIKLIKQEKRVGFMAHVIVGYPTLPDTIRVVETMDAARVDFVELQIPFSDPLADGPTIMRACEVALENGTRVKDAFLIAGKLSKKVRVPLLFMAYYNTVFKFGVEKFCKKAAEAGIAGLIVPDMPLEEEQYEKFTLYARKFNLHVIRVLSPASTILRIQKNTNEAAGFVYCTARQGITGNHKALDPKVILYLKEVKRNATTPIALGFGIASKEDVILASKYADIVVVGSAIVKIAEKYKDEQLVKEVGKFLGSLRV